VPLAEVELQLEALPRLDNKAIACLQAGLDAEPLPRPYQRTH